MNRADQAPEPSIEELLASIRLIISDADKQGSVPARGIGALGGAGRAPAGEMSAGDVFDLTDELAFAEQQEMPQAGAPRASMRSQAGTEGYSWQPPHPGPHRGALPEANQVPYPGARQGASPAVAQAAWSRRELPADAAQAQAAPRLRQEPPTPRPLARNWAGDIQMPVSEQGPVPLFPAPPGNAAVEAFASAVPAEIEAVAEVAPPEAQGEGAVAVLAQRLARSAMGVLEASELENAKQVDFKHMDAQRKVEVAEKFADAIEVVAQAVEEESEQLEVVDAQAAAEQEQLLRQQQQAAAEQEQLQRQRQQQAAKNDEASVAAAAKEEAPEAPEAKGAADAQADAPAPAKAEVMAEVTAEVKAEAPVKEEAPSKPEPLPQAPAAAAKAPEPAAAKAESLASVAPAKPAPAPAPVAVLPLAQAQFMGTVPVPVSAQVGGPLETAVREMLRPLLVQWLNENMPRILENAIREEIAVRGLLQKLDS